MATPSAVILDCAGTALSADERDFFRDLNPYGFILFARNCKTPEQVRALTDEMRELLGRDELPILIDQEGGRVMRLKPPVWRACPAAGKLAALPASEEAIYLNARLIAHDLRAVGVNVDCAPVADIRVPGAHDIIGDRAYGETPEDVIRLGGAMAQGLMDGGVIPVLKHIPGHGRASVDSHHELPVVDAPLELLRKTDFVAFKGLSELPMAMTAHVIYTAIDAADMATTSPKVIRLIREELGFDGLLMSDDISMKAMRGNLAERTLSTLAAGCDIVLHCNGTPEEQREVASVIVPMNASAIARSERAFASIRQGDFDAPAAEAQLASLMQAAA